MLVKALANRFDSYFYRIFRQTTICRCLSTLDWLQFPGSVLVTAEALKWFSVSLKTYTSNLKTLEPLANIRWEDCVVPSHLTSFFLFCHKHKNPRSDIVKQMAMDFTVLDPNIRNTRLCVYKFQKKVWRIKFNRTVEGVSTKDHAYMYHENINLDYT